MIRYTQQYLFKVTLEPSHCFKSCRFLSVPLRGCDEFTSLLEHLLTRDHRIQTTMWTSRSVVVFRWDPRAYWGESRRVGGRVWWGDRFAWSICRRADTWSAFLRCAYGSVASARQSARISSHSPARYIERASRLRKHPKMTGIWEGYKIVFFTVFSVNTYRYNNTI